MDALKELQNFKEKLEKELAIYLEAKKKEAAKVSPLSLDTMEKISNLTLASAKRVRPALMYYSYLAHGGKDEREILLTSMALEIFQTYLLIHDDIIDNDQVRRGVSTIHTLYQKEAEEKYPGKTDSKHYGINLAILAGNIASALTNEILSGSNFKAEYKIRAIEELNKVDITENYGEALDVLSGVKEDNSQEDLIKIHELKTVPYTFDGPIKIGAILAGCKEEDLAQLDNYIIPLGTAFQIQDDVLGMFGSEDKTGKPVTSDLREGKKTLLIIYALEKANKEQKEIILKNLGKQDVTLEDLEEVRKVIIDTGSLEYSKKYAQELVKKSFNAINSLDLEPVGKDFLLGIAEYMIKRDL